MSNEEQKHEGSGLSHDDTTRASSADLDVVVIIVAAGRGIRAGGASCPKQYRLLCDESVLSHTVKAFRLWNSNCMIVIVRNAADEDLLETALRERDANIFDTVGGCSRQSSVLAGLEYVATSSRVPSYAIIHDAVRPFVTCTVLERVKESLTKCPDAGAVVGIPIVDTLKHVNPDGRIITTVSRDGLHQVQTPQAFRFDTILKVHRQASSLAMESVTDDAGLYEWAGLPVQVVRGETRNIKLTYEEDFDEAERILRREKKPKPPDVRVGHGYDTHKVIQGEQMTLCGVQIRGDLSLLGHSDADVGLHAVTDALLGTIGAGDIGTQFPPSETQWKDMQSEHFLRFANRLVLEAGGTVTHCDITLICEAPMISPYREAMRSFVARAIGLHLYRVSIKATTNEKMGFVGRQEGIVALATATAVFQ